jgi:gliding motility-associated-like protein
MFSKEIKFSFLFLFLFVQSDFFGQNSAPILTSTGNQIFCPGTSLKIVTDFNIIDTDDLGIDALYIQISTGYVFGEDLLTLTGNHPTIVSNWNALTGKLTLTGVSSQPTYFDLIAAVKDIVYSSNVSNPTGVKKFSVTVGQANYLPSTGHYYTYIQNIGITWIAAKTLAQTSTYYGLIGYLATITSADESQIAGEQSSGAGWIGGSDEQQEGVWKWMTGPEVGTVFWNGLSNGSTPNFANWNSGEPNSLGNENYAHITAPGVGNLGSWNDLSNTGETSGNYQPKGYIVEFGGLPGDPILQISTSTTITIPTISIVSSYSNCGVTSFTLSANSSAGTINWYENPIGGLPIFSGNDYTTPILSASKTYYLDAYPANCSTSTRTPLVVTINEIPTISASNSNSICEGFTATLSATPSIGIINWYENASGGTSITTGNSFTTPLLFENKTYYAEANNNGCLSLSRTAILVTVAILPIIKDEFYEICENKKIVLDAGVSNYSYQWSTGETSQTIETIGLENYSVVITSPNNCSKTKTFSVSKIIVPIIDTVLIDETTATILTENSGDFEYSIDGIRYQTSNVFSIEQGGVYTAFVRDVFLCKIVVEDFVFVKIEKFFTPNNDGENDLWTLNTISYFPKAEISIFDKFGKLLTILNNQNPSWNGTFNNQNLPSSDYWYVLKIDETKPVKKGHFSLVR